MIFKLFLLVLALTGGVLLLTRLVTGFYARSRTYDTVNAPAGRVAIVFGAGLGRDGSPSPVLRDRVATAVELYLSGKVEKILMSGDNRYLDYNEPGAMRSYALSLGVPSDAIVLDYAGRRTYDTCYRAGRIFKVKEAILVTQQFHLPRAIFTCNMLGLNVIGVRADRQVYLRRSRIVWNSRETIATTVALWELFISKPLPVLGDPEPIFPREA